MNNTGDGDRQQLHQQAHELRKSGNLKAAIEILFDLLAGDVTDGVVVTDLASTLAEDDQLGRAERAFRHAFKVAGDVPQLAVDYGAFLARSGRQQELKELLEAKCESLVALGKRVVERGDDEVDLEAYRDLGNAALNLARLLVETGKPDEALSLAETFLTDAFHWRMADEIACAANEALEGDDVSLAWKLFDRKAASPMMVWRIAENLASLTDDPVETADILIEAAEFLSARMLLTCMVGQKDLTDLLRWVGTELERLFDEGDPQAATAAERLESMLLEVCGEDVPRAASPTEQLCFDFSAE